MARILLLFSLCVSLLSAHGQYLPNTGQSYQFASMFNPAFSGINEFSTITSGYAYRWAGLEGGPRNLNVSFNTRLIKPIDFQTNAPHVSSIKLVRVPAARRIIGGFGANVFAVTYGQIVTNGGSFNFASHFPIGKARLAIGISALIENTKLDLSGVTFREPDQYANSLMAQGTTKTILNVRAGFLFYTPRLFVGMSYFPITTVDLQPANIATSNPTIYNGSIQAGYSIAVSPELTLKPSVYGLLKTAGGVSLDYGVKAYIQQKAFVGITYRDIKAGVMIVGLNVNPAFTVSYSYERSFAKFKPYNDGSHELILSLRVNNFKKLTPFTW